MHAKPTVPSLDLGLVSDKLSGQIVNMLPPEVMSSTAIKLGWEVRRNQRFVEGFHIRYRVVPDLDERGGGRGSTSPSSATDFTVETVQSSAATMYTLHNLDKHTWYEIHVQPFYLSVVGQESNVVRARTLEDGQYCF